MRSFTAFCAAALILAASTACGDPQPDQTADQTTDTPADPGAGFVLRIDPALDALVPTDYHIEKLSAGFAFTEGPVWVSEGSYLLFSDLRSNRIHRWDAADGLSTFMDPVFEGDPAGRSVGSNGLNIDSEGRLILLEHGNRRVSRIEADGSITVLVDNYQGMRLNSPNDSAIRSDGWLYFTDPPYGLAGLEDDPARELDFNGIYRLSPDGELELLERNQTRPNGIAFSPDERTLYVANSDASNKVWMAYDVQDDGTLANGRVFFDVNSETAEGAADGMKVDLAGNIFATGPGGVWIFDPTGKHLGTIQPDEVPANVAWGDDGRTLYMTARTGLYRIALTTQGTIR
jgi:gluconolactonase